MPTVRVKFHQFERGLWLVGGKEQTNAAWLRRNRGINILRTPSIRSRLGSTILYNASAYQLYDFNGVRFYASGNAFYRDGVSILVGLTPNAHFALTRMPPQVAVFDYLFLTAGLMKKVDAAGSVTNWGIAAPTTNFTAAAGAGGTPNATYTYWVTFKNLSTGSRSNSNPTGQAIALANQKGALSNLPISTDPQVNAREIYRSVANGAVGFLLTTINDNVTTTYTDNAADSALGTQQLQLDNTPPATTYGDAWGPWQGVMWWARDSAAGLQGRVYYSPLSRPEAVSSFIDITNPDDPTQKGLEWNGSNWVMTQKKLFQITGPVGGPYTYNPVAGVPGTTQPFTVIGTPYGIAYQALDGIRLFDGVTSALLGAEQIGPLFRGESAENLTSFIGTVAEYSRDEYIISDGTQTLAFHFPSKEWRDLGIGVSAFFQEQEHRVLQAAFNNKIYSLEDWNTVTDGGTAITFEVEIAAFLPTIDATNTVQRIYVDLNTNGQAIHATLLYDGQTLTLPDIVTAQRGYVEISVNQTARLQSLRLTGNLTAAVEIFGIEADVYLPSYSGETPMQQLQSLY